MFEIMYESMKKAFEAKAQITEHGLEWHIPYGYVCWSIDGFNIQVRSHRVSWMIANGQSVPEGHDIDHDPSCPKTCVTPEHLQALSKSDHVRLGWERGELNGGWGTKRDRIHEPKELFAWQVELACPQCGVIFVPIVSHQIYCDDGCKERASTVRRFPRPETKICEWGPCGIEFPPKRIDSRFCSRKCIDDNQNAIKKSRKGALNALSG